VSTAIRGPGRATRSPSRFTMLIGPTSNGALVEIGVLDAEGDDPVVIHAMPLRAKFYPFLG
jgi:hypothetical protein